MATAREWAIGYLSQAREDLKGASAVSGQAPSVFAMLLQMTFEKLAKAALLRSNQMTVDGAQRTHAAASRMIHVLRLTRGSRQRTHRRWNIHGRMQLHARSVGRLVIYRLHVASATRASRWGLTC